MQDNDLEIRDGEDNLLTVTDEGDIFVNMYSSGDYYNTCACFNREQAIEIYKKLKEVLV